MEELTVLAEIEHSEEIKWPFTAYRSGIWRFPTLSIVADDLIRLSFSEWREHYNALRSGAVEIINGLTFAEWRALPRIPAFPE